MWMCPSPASSSLQLRQMAIPRFTAIDGFSDAAASTDLANIAVKYQSRGMLDLLMNGSRLAKKIGFE